MTAAPGVLGLELLGIPVRLACDDPSLRERLAICYARMPERDVSRAAALHACVERDPAGWRIRVDGRHDRREGGATEALRALNHELVHAAMLRAPALYYVHAAVVVRRERAIVLPGRSRAGKSTLALAFLLESARFLSDELLAFDPVRARACAFPRAIKIREECDAYFPELAGAFRGDGEGRFLPFGALPNDVVADEGRVDAVVVPRWTGERDTRLARISRGEAVLALAESSLNFGTHRQASLDCLAAIVQGAETFALEWHQPREAARVVLAELTT